jgi:hypothetical protein
VLCSLLYLENRLKGSVTEKNVLDVTSIPGVTRKNFIAGSACAIPRRAEFFSPSARREEKKERSVLGCRESLSPPRSKRAGQRARKDRSRRHQSALARARSAAGGGRRWACARAAAGAWSCCARSSSRPSASASATAAAP